MGPGRTRIFGTEVRVFSTEEQLSRSSARDSTYPQPYCDDDAMAVGPVAPSVRLKSRPPSSLDGQDDVC